MSSDTPMFFRLMTYNIGGGRKNHDTDYAALRDVITQAQPDILALQEVNQYVPLVGDIHSQLDVIREAITYPQHEAYFPTLSMKHDFHSGKKPMVDALFNDLVDWQQGNALITRWPFHRMGARGQAGAALDIPLFRPPNYLGNRDTDPRHAIIARLGVAPLYPVVIALHLTTLVGERTGDNAALKEQAQTMRTAQVGNLLAVIKEHLLDAGEVVFLLGDFNAGVDEGCIRRDLIEEAGFTHLEPENDDTATHRTAQAKIDHIFIHTGKRAYTAACKVITSGAVELASDHRPVTAEVTFN